MVDGGWGLQRVLEPKVRGNAKSQSEVERCWDQGSRSEFIDQVSPETVTILKFSY